MSNPQTQPLQADNGSYSRGPIGMISKLTRKWDLREWVVAGIMIQVFSAAGYQFVVDLFPESAPEDMDIVMSAELDFVEFQEVKADTPVDSKDLSDKIIEKEKLTEKQQINWENAADPSLDLNQRYVARLMVNISPDDYPTRARRANIGRVVVAVSLYISAGGTIRDVRIRNIRSQGDSAKPFSSDFHAAVRKILLQKTKLLTPPYRQDGNATDFVWDTTVTFTIQ